MKKTILGIFIAICALIFSIFLTGNLQYEFASKTYVTPPPSPFSPSPNSEISFADFHKLEHRKTVRLRARIAIQSQCPRQGQADYAPEKYAECMREAEKSLSVPLFEPLYTYKYDVEKYGFDGKLTLDGKFVVNPKSFPNAKPSWYDGSTELVITGQKVRTMELNGKSACIYDDLFEIFKVEEVQH